MLRKIPGGLESKNIREQVMRSATAVGANYREANRAESSADFVHKIGDWLDCLIRIGEKFKRVIEPGLADFVESRVAELFLEAKFRTSARAAHRGDDGGNVESVRRLAAYEFKGVDDCTLVGRFCRFTADYPAG